MAPQVFIRPTTGPAVRLTVETLRAQCRAARPPPPLAPAAGGGPHGVHPASVVAKGRYAALVTWSDGHVSIFPYAVLLALPDEP